MKILFYDAKPYDEESFLKEQPKFPEIEIEYLKTDISPRTASLAKGYDAVCAFVSSDLGRDTLEVLADQNVKLLLMRCAGFNNVDLETARDKGITILRVPGYSPEAVAEHAMALAMAVNRRIHKEYIKVRENNFSLVGLMGKNMHGKTAGIIGTGKIGAAMARICYGYGMRILGYDKFPNPSLEFIEYQSLNEVFEQSDLISLHCPLTDENYHMINSESIARMKKDVIFINTSRGELVDTKELIAGIRNHKFHGVGLDVYEEERDNVFENREDDILETSVTARLLSFPNVIVTSHQAFFTEEALEAIANMTLQNAMDFESGNLKKENLV